MTSGYRESCVNLSRRLFVRCAGSEAVPAPPRHAAGNPQKLLSASVCGSQSMTEVTADIIDRGRGPDTKTAGERRRIAARVREAREKLTSAGSGHRAFDVELMQLFAQGKKQATPSYVILAIVAAAVATAWAPHAALILWISIELIIIFVAYGLAARFTSLDPAAINVARWRTQ